MSRVLRTAREPGGRACSSQSNDTRRASSHEARSPHGERVPDLTARCGRGREEEESHVTRLSIQE